MPREPLPSTTKIAAPIAPAPAECASPPGLWLLWSGEQTCSRTIPLVSCPLLIGRGQHSEPGKLSLDDERVSRRHAVVRYAPPLNLFTVEDAGSTNGLFVNGARVRTAGLAAGDVIRVGDTLLLFSPLPGPGCGNAAAAVAPGLVARSPAMLGILDIAVRIAPSELTVLVTGETGCGKEVLAREIHRLSGRSGPFQAVNCGALPEALAESELFGHRRGAFTGAHDDRPGLLRAAERGTLFLDEIGELPPVLQVKLLRVLEERTVRPVGDVRQIPVDFRLLAATNRKLTDEADGRAFRADLYARINEINLEIPPLRGRREEIPALFCHFLDRYRPADAAPQRPSADLIEALLLHRWPHNVRELEKLAKRTAVLWADREQLELEVLPLPLQEPLLARAPGRDAVRAEPGAGPGVAGSSGGGGGEPGIPGRQELEALLVHHGGNVANIARHYGRDRGQVYRWIRKHGIALDEIREGQGNEPSEGGA